MTLGSDPEGKVRPTGALARAQRGRGVKGIPLRIDSRDLIRPESLPLGWGQILLGGELLDSTNCGKYQSPMGPYPGGRPLGDNQFLRSPEIVSGSHLLI